MDESKREIPLPLKTFHEFILELDREWDKFRMGSLLSIITTIILLMLFIPRYFIFTIRREGPIETLIALGIVAALVYSVYLSYRQHSFYRRWEKRLGLLLQLEEQTLEEKKP